MFELRMLIVYIIATLYLIFLGKKFGNDLKLFFTPKALLGYVGYLFVESLLSQGNFSVFKIPGMFLVIALLYLLITKRSVLESLKFSLAAMFFNVLAELLFAAVTIAILRMDPNLFTNQNNLYILSNMIIYGLASLISQVKSIVKTFKEVEKTDKIIGTMFGGVIVSFLIGLIAYRNEVISGEIDTIINLSLAIIGPALVYYVFKIRNEKNKVSDQYDILFKNIEKFENELSKSRKIMHEYKNQLMVMRGLAATKSEELTKYIESIIGEVKNQKIEGIKGIEKIESSLMKGLLYYKLNEIEENKIHFEIINHTMDSKRNKRKDKQYYENMEKRKDVMKIIGVALDNAIEAAAKADKKELIFETKVEKTQYKIIISNTFAGKIDEARIGKMGYSTKGKNRGFGLSIIKDITTKDKKLEFKHSIINNMYVAEITIK